MLDRLFVSGFGSAFLHNLRFADLTVASVRAPGRPAHP
jgi:hypothetical protein